MPRNPIAISSGHGKYIAGAVDIMREHDEAVKVVNRVGQILTDAGVDCVTFEDTTSRDQSTNLSTIVNWHNSQDRVLDVSVHFDSNGHTTGPLGTSCLWVTQQELAGNVSEAIARASGLKDRGDDYRPDLYFLQHTTKPAILIETCFVTSQTDVDLYRTHFEAICQAIAETIYGEALQPEPGPEPEPTPDYVTVTLSADKPVALKIVAGTNVTLVSGPAPEPMPPPGELPPMFTDAQQAAIRDIAANSPIASYSWRDRGRAPTGYTEGMAIAFAQAYVRLIDMDDPIAWEMAKANTHDDAVDALSWYNSNFASLGMSNENGGIDTLRHLFVLLMGLGMRESSGRHCEGRDMSASNTTAETAEAGLFQQSWNSRSCSSYIVDLYEQYEVDSPQGYMHIFAQGVSCDSSEWSCYGSGDGFEFQKLLKYNPTFAAETAAIILRDLRQHFGPINRKEAELRREADDMFRAVQYHLESTV